MRGLSLPEPAHMGSVFSRLLGDDHMITMLRVLSLAPEGKKLASSCPEEMEGSCLLVGVVSQ